MEERVRASPSFGTESEPTAPGPVVGLVAAFCLAIKHEAAVWSTDKTYDKVSLGSGQISKFEGLCSG